MTTSILVSLDICLSTVKICSDKVPHLESQVNSIVTHLHQNDLSREWMVSKDELQMMSRQEMVPMLRRSTFWNGCPRLQYKSHLHLLWASMETHDSIVYSLLYLYGTKVLLFLHFLCRERAQQYRKNQLPICIQIEDATANRQFLLHRPQELEKPPAFQCHISLHYHWIALKQANVAYVD